MHLRLSVTDRCGLRCPYCQPTAPGAVTPGARLLSPAQIHRIVRALAAVGTTHVRLTGGEPLGRRDSVEIVAAIRSVPGIQDIAITTNALGLAALAQPLADAGLSRVNVHLDTLRPDRYRALTGGGALSDALDGIAAALAAGLQPVKINTVLMKGINDDELEDFCLVAGRWGVTVRFIELMNTGPASAFVAQHFMTASEARTTLSRRHALAPRLAYRNGSPAQEYIVDGGAARIGFIASESEPFCDNCDRLRVTCDGRLMLCLYQPGGFDVRALVENAALDEDGVARALRKVLGTKRSHHPAFGETGDRLFAMAQLGG